MRIRSSPSFFSSSPGFTLVELLIALTIAAFLVTGTLIIVARTVVAYSHESEMTKMNETARFVLNYLGNQIRVSGYWGCIQNITALNINSGEPTANYQYNISGTSNVNDPTNTSDTLNLLGTDSTGTPVRVTATGTTTQLTVTNASSFSQNNIVLAADCNSGDIAKIQSVSGNTLTLTQPLSTAYGSSAFVYKVVKYSFNIQTGDDGLSTLFETSSTFSTSSSVQLVNNIVQINILYGEDTDGDGAPNFYRKAQYVSNMNNVVSIHIDIVVASDNTNMVPSPMQYTFNGSTITAPDNRLYKVYSATIARRNGG